MFNSKNGIIVACDVNKLDDFSNLIIETCELGFIQGYKIGINLVIPYGIYTVIEVIRRYTLLPIIYDHQKFGTDIPDVCSGKTLDVLKESGVDGIIIFPQSGPETLHATIKACIDKGLVPIVGGEMTHKRYLVSDGGYIINEAPEKIYIESAQLGVKYFVIPGTKIDNMKKYCSIIENITKEPKFLFPGIGKGQGGDIIDAFKAVKPYSSYAIVGREIYTEKNRKEAAKKIWDNVKKEINL